MWNPLGLISVLWWAGSPATAADLDPQKFVDYSNAVLVIQLRTLERMYDEARMPIMVDDVAREERIVRFQWVLHEASEDLFALPTLDGDRDIRDAIAGVYGWYERALPAYMRRSVVLLDSEPPTRATVAELEELTRTLDSQFTAKMAVVMADHQKLAERYHV